jgi:hypothetical protein
MKLELAIPEGRNRLSASRPSEASLSEMTRPSSDEVDRGGQAAPEITRWSVASRAVIKREAIRATFLDAGSSGGRRRGPSE